MSILVSSWNACGSLYLIEVVQGFVQVGVHAHRRFICDFDGVLQNALWNDVTLRRRRGFGTDEDPKVLVAALAVLF